MALSREQKEAILNEYTEKLQRAPVLVWASYRGMSVPQSQDLRQQLRDVGGEIIVIKNTLMRLALEKVGRPVPTQLIDGPCMVAMVYDNVAATTKVVADFARLNEAMFQLKGGIVGTQIVDAEQIRALTMLPSREVMLARVVGGIQAPLSSFVGTLAAVLRGVMNVLNARAQQLEGQA